MNWNPTQSIWDEAERKAQAQRGSNVVVLAEHRRKNGAAESTVDALMYSLRRGLSALGSSDPMQRGTLQRLSELTEKQIKDCCEKLQTRKPPISQAWKDTEIAELISVWGKVRR